MLFINGQNTSFNQAKSLAPESTHSDVIIKRMVKTSDPHTFQHQELFKINVSLRSNIIDSALALAKSHASFETFYYTKCNTKFWSVSDQGGLKLKSQVKPSQALSDIFQQGYQYGFECATAMEIVLLGGVLKTFGNKVFDHLYQDLYLWDWNDVTNLPLRIDPVKDTGIPGDVRYFKNPDVSPDHQAFQGENVIVLPNDKYYGHGVGIGDKDFMISNLNRARRTGATKSAYLMPRATRIALEKLHETVEGFKNIPQPTLSV